MKLEVGQFIRTDLGEIGKITSIASDNVFGNGGMTFYNSEPFLRGKEVKASFNIIDILEVEDYVNGEKVIRIFSPMFLSIGELPYIITVNSKYEPQDIKTIVTHEQMEQMEYKVEE